MGKVRWYIPYIHASGTVPALCHCNPGLYVLYIHTIPTDVSKCMTDTHTQDVRHGGHQKVT